jgi:hypothetical protein
VTTYVLDDHFVLAEGDSSQPTHPTNRRYHYAKHPLAVNDSAGFRFESSDALGSVTDLTSATGSVAATRLYDARS